MFSPWDTPDDRLATPADAMREYAQNAGEDVPEAAWILTPYDVWMRNPHYSGPEVPHPDDWHEDDEHGPEDWDGDGRPREWFDYDDDGR